jgi:hypothetical protein
MFVPDTNIMMLNPHIVIDDITLLNLHNVGRTSIFQVIPLDTDNLFEIQMPEKFDKNYVDSLKN